MKTLELKSPATGRSFTKEHVRNAHSKGAMAPPLYESWGDLPHEDGPVLKTEPCIPCCTIL